MRRLISHDMYTTVFGTVYLALMTNLLLVVGALPLVVGLVTTDPVRSWPLLAVLATVSAPAVCAAFAVFAAYTADGSVDVVRTFVRAWRASARGALRLGALAATATVVLAVDVRALWGRPVGAVAIPVLVVLIVLVLAVTVLSFAALAEVPTARVRDVLRASVYLAVRRWYLTAASLATLGLLLALFAAKPAIAMGLAAAPLLYAVWGNSRFTLRPVLAPSAAPVVAA
ncbi:ferredoxin-NADPH reductase [Cellulomonas sp. WB94]|uniref:ferredoxin-NADPH reductase n=1 Tax=Cellulomonas sp. WB94 TaxID=2173174 RepID=UPI001F5B4019|nr:ferredoxin-NADPH reductase [Cellulomonas sp. WB94]